MLAALFKLKRFSILSDCEFNTSKLYTIFPTDSRSRSWQMFFQKKNFIKILQYSTKNTRVQIQKKETLFKVIFKEKLD